MSESSRYKLRTIELDQPIVNKVHAKRMEEAKKADLIINRSEKWIQLLRYLNKPKSCKDLRDLIKKHKLRKSLRYAHLSDLYKVAGDALRDLARNGPDGKGADPAHQTPAEKRFIHLILSALREQTPQGKLPVIMAQVHIGAYFYDFVLLRRFNRICSAVAFEINGGVHNREDKQKKDSSKFENFKKVTKGGIIMDVTNEKVYSGNLKDCLELISDSSPLQTRKKYRLWIRIFLSSIAVALADTRAREPVLKELAKLGYTSDILDQVFLIIEKNKPDQLDTKVSAVSTVETLAVESNGGAL